jgi:2-isopropylmalate synthase
VVYLVYEDEYVKNNNIENENKYAENKIKQRRIKIFDTTLRDGEQSPGASMTIEQKVKVAKQLEKMGVDIIEAGFPASSDKDFESVKKIADEIKNCEVCALARCTKNDIDSAWSAIKDAKYPRIHVFLATSQIHLKDKLKMSENEAIQRIKENVAYAKSFCKNIEFSAEDATRSEFDFLKKALTVAVESGATTINIPDSVGYAQPKEYGELIKKISSDKKFVGIDISVHCHDDLGVATSNSIFGIENGATQVECTINGIGERAGNAALEEIVMGLKTRSDYYNAICGIDTKEIIPTSKMVAESTNIFVQKNKSIVGANAFSHEAGIHQHGMINNPKCYEVVDVSNLGAETKLVIGRHSGKHAVLEFLKKNSIPINDESIMSVMNFVKNSPKEECVEEKIISIFKEVF